MVKVLMSDKRHLDASKVIPMFVDDVWQLHLYRVWDKDNPVMVVPMSEVLQISG